MNKERRKRLDEAVKLLEKASDIVDEAYSIIEECRDEEQEYYDNMPEGIQMSEKGDLAESAIEEMENALDCIDEIDFEDIENSLINATE